MPEEWALAADDLDSVVEIQNALGLHHGLLGELQKIKLRQTSAQSNLTIFDDNIQTAKLVIAGLLQTAANRSFQFAVRRRSGAGKVWSRCGF